MLNIKFTYYNIYLFDVTGDFGIATCCDFPVSLYHAAKAMPRRIPVQPSRPVPALPARGGSTGGDLGAARAARAGEEKAQV